jgi:hypothetical protein
MVMNNGTNPSDPAISYMDAVFAAYEDWFGKPSDTLRLKAAPGSPGPAELGIIVYLPESSPNGSTLTLLGTAGMSVKEMDGPIPLAELGMEIEGRLAPEELEATARRLADLAAVPFQTGAGYRLDSILEVPGQPLFERFDTVYLIDWDSYDKLRPQGYGKAFPLLRLVPVFELEARFIENSKNRAHAYLDLKRKGLNPADFKRGPAVE